MWGYIIFFIFLALIIFIAFKSIKIVRESEVYLIERLGKFHKSASAGLTIIIPFIDKVRSIVSLKQQTLDIPPQEVITKDNVSITIDTVVFYKITDPVKAVYEISNLKKSIEYISVTTIRDIIGKMDLDASFSSRDSINEKLRAVMADAVDKWGCNISRVEVQNITPPQDVKDAMEKQMNAERNKRAAVLEAEGQRQAAILRAQGEKEAAILEADANRESQIRRAAGEADAIRSIAQAKAEEVKLIYGAMMSTNPSDKVIQLKSLETLKEVANGDANKVFIPFEAAPQLASLGTMKEMFVDDKGKKKAKKDLDNE